MACQLSAEPARVTPRRQESADYVYAIVEGLPPRWKPPAAGVGDAPVTARAVRDLSLITSTIDTVPRPTPKTVALHDDVVLSTLEADAVLPLEFGTVTAPVHADAWLTAHLAFVRVHLARLRRHVEMTVRLVSLDGADAMSAPLRSTAECLVERAGLVEWRYRHDSSSSLGSSLAFLVPREGVGDFLARIAPVAARARTIAVVPTGPSAPLSFAPLLRGALTDMSRPLARAG